MRVNNLAVAAALLAIAWGVLSFGAVYAWAYWPLMAVAIASGTAGFASGGTKRSPPAALGAALGVLWVATAAQLIPIPTEILAKVSPATDRLLQRYDLSYVSPTTRPVSVMGENSAATPNRGAAGVARTHPLSIRPGATWLGLAFLSALSIFMLGLSRVLSVSGSRRLVPGVVLLGLAVAVIGIVQSAFSTEKIYGLWEPESRGDSFDPFVNRNHFAGWMVMALSLGVGHFCAGVARAMRGAKPGWRNRLLWFSSPQANKLVLTAFALVVMALSLVLSMSRSGITCLAIALMLGGWFVGRQLGGGSRGALAAGYLAFVFLVAVGWTGIDVVGKRFAAASWETFGGRFGAWGDAVLVIRDFPVAGTGLNAYGTAMLFYQSYRTDVHFSAAHNDYLQLLAEGGLLLAVPAGFAVAVFVRIVRQRFLEESDEGTFWIRAGAVSGLVAIALQEVVEFSLQMPGNATLFCVLVAIAIHRAPPRPTVAGHGSKRLWREVMLAGQLRPPHRCDARQAGAVRRAARGRRQSVREADHAETPPRIDAVTIALSERVS